MTAGSKVEDAASGAANAEDDAVLRRLEEEGEIAADYVQELLDIADLDGEIIDIFVEHGRASVAITSEAKNQGSLRKLVGKNGEVLEAMQELTRIAVQTRTGERSRLMLDLAGFRARRRAELTDVARDAVAEVKASQTSLALNPMNAFERKVVHDVVAAAGLISESEGVEPNRRVVIRAS